MPPEPAGSASSVLTTAQQIGNALGVAIAGAVFFGALGDASSAHAYDRALAISLTWTAATAMLSTLLALRLAAPDPRQRHASARADTVPSAMAVANQQPEVARRAA